MASFRRVLPTDPVTRIAIAAAALFVLLEAIGFLPPIGVAYR